MDLIKSLSGNYNLLVLLRTVCDVEVLPEFKTPRDAFGHLTYNMPGMTFAVSGSAENDGSSFSGTGSLFDR